MKVLATIFLFLIVSFLIASEGSAQSSAETKAAREFDRLVKLSVALSKIPTNRQNREPHRSFLKRNDNDIVFSEPAGEWYVRSSRFWELRKKYSTLAIADKIAWTAAENSLPGECEGYVNCYLAKIRMTHAEYLTIYPKGTYSRRAVRRIIEYLTYMTDDAAAERSSYEGPTDPADRADFTKAIKDLRRILARVAHPEAAKAVSQLKVIENAYK